MQPSSMNYVLSILLTLLQVHATAQPNGVSIYAYEQKIIPGIEKARDVTEEGLVIKKPQLQTYQYYIYVTAPPIKKLLPLTLWIKGEPFDVTPEYIHQTPVAIEIYQVNNTFQKIELVPRTTAQVMRLYPVKNKSIIKGNERKFYPGKELMLLYKSKGKTYCLTEAKFQVLPPASLP